MSQAGDDVPCYAMCGSSGSFVDGALSDSGSQTGVWAQA